MEVFRGVEFAALRLWPCGSFLHADEDGRSVYHGSVRDGDAWLPNAVWAVEELVAGASHTRYVLLRGAYGRYLGAGAPDARDRDQERCACPLPSCPLPCCRETLCIVLIRPNTPVNDRLLTSILKAEDDATRLLLWSSQHRQNCCGRGRKR
ncbi:hypothetical protein OsI_33187 [Oryza sativa Indica Group]|uniref:DUF569 domain-containing protein n=1 Tax=Oryza sativa subsp. indica TaxID=39946 RepID=B8BGD9_ORYSI|nr:hypothetical protein OsI_33187 [Oryza sativa Indica Group]